MSTDVKSFWWDTVHVNTHALPTEAQGVATMHSTEHTSRASPQLSLPLQHEKWRHLCLHGTQALPSSLEGTTTYRSALAATLLL